MLGVGGILRALGRGLGVGGRGRACGRPRVAAAPAAADGGLEAAKELLIGLEACQRGFPQLAYEAFHRAFIHYVQAGDRRSASLAQKTIALVLLKIQNPTRVRTALRNSLRMLQQAGLKDEEVRALFFMGDFEAKQRAFKDAYFHYEESLKLAREIGYIAGEAECLCHYARALGWHGRIKEVDRRLAEAAKVAKTAEDPALEALVAAWTKRLAEGQSFSLAGAGARRAA